jgi:26S proteasome regulatory subunit N6
MLQKLWDEAKALKGAEALSKYFEIVKDQTMISEEDQKIKENVIYEIGNYYVANKELPRLTELILNVRGLIAYMPQAKIAKIIRMLYDKLIAMEGGLEASVSVGNEIIEWCVKDKRTFLKHRTQTKLACVYLDLKKYNEALKVLDQVLYEVRKLEDMLLLVDIHLVETKVYIALENIPKGKASLTAVKTAATTVNLHPAVQAEIDLLSGYIAAEEKDYSTGFSYFYEAYQGLTSLKDPKAKQTLIYMLMCKIMMKANDDVFSILNSKLGVQHQSLQTEVMKAIATANKNKSIVEFDFCVNKYKGELQDSLIKNHINRLYTQLLEDNIKKIIQPYSRVELEHVSKLIGLPIDKVQQKYFKNIEFL